MAFILQILNTHITEFFLYLWFIITLNALHWKSKQSRLPWSSYIHLLWCRPGHLLLLCMLNCEQRVKWLIKMYYCLANWGARQVSRPSWCREALPFSGIITSLSTSHTPSFHSTLSSRSPSLIVAVGVMMSWRGLSSWPYSVEAKPRHHYTALTCHQLRIWCWKECTNPPTHLLHLGGVCVLHAFTT